MYVHIRYENGATAVDSINDPNHSTLSACKMSYHCITRSNFKTDK